MLANGGLIDLAFTSVNAGATGYGALAAGTGQISIGQGVSITVNSAGKFGLGAEPGGRVVGTQGRDGHRLGRVGAEHRSSKRTAARSPWDRTPS